MDSYSQHPQAQQALNKIVEAKARISIAETTAQRDYQNALAEFYKWARRYELAIQENRQDLISHAKFQMERHEAIAKRLAKLLGEQMPHLNTLKEKVRRNMSQLAQINGDLTLNTEDYTPVKQILSDISQDISNSIEKSEITLVSPLVEDIDIPLILTASLDKEQEEQPEDSLEISIQETKKFVQLAIETQNDLQQKYNRIYTDAKVIHETLFEALLENDINLLLKAIIDKKVKTEISDFIKIQLQQQKEIVKILQTNLNRLENLKITSCINPISRQ
ncbi:MAG: hypothetical protein C6Y22_06270 [Hapalosiphonaceae cyanobacterium JJU2]|nr:MAG: hypothetical protein C6Y22_06270 [Hapalosiphonaceae cyanobacterium JJU2]